jgi:hypothetical protein
MLPRALAALALSTAVALQAQSPLWSFAVSGDSRNCGDFVMPAIAARVRAAHDVFYWHLGDFRWISEPDEDLQSMQPAPLDKAAYERVAWNDFVTHQLVSFGTLPVFLGRGNHEVHGPFTREAYVARFANWLNRPEIAAARQADGMAAAPVGPWYHWTRDGVDFITLDNAAHEEFSDAQMRWLRALLDRDLAPRSGIQTIVVGMHEALPHSTGSDHAMDDWPRGRETGEQVYQWFLGAQRAGKHVYLIASHSHYYSPDVFRTPYWEARGGIVPGYIIGLAGAHRYKLPGDARPGARAHIYGYMEGRVMPGGAIDFQLRELSESELMRYRWPNAPVAAVHECFVHNADTLPVPRHFPFF